VIRISKDRRAKLREAVFQVIRQMAPDAEKELQPELNADPYPILSDEDRAFNLLVRETFKICLDHGLKLDGNREKLIRDGIGSLCGFCGLAMIDKGEIGLDHTQYDGRPPRPVHRSCHKKHQPH
jgi:hypothetical protein